MRNLKLIIIVYGQYVPVLIPASKKEEFNKTIKDCVEKHLWFNTEDHHILGNAIQGWYFMENEPSISEKMLKIVEKSIEGGDDWKNNE